MALTTKDLMNWLTVAQESGISGELIIHCMITQSLKPTARKVWEYIVETDTVRVWHTASSIAGDCGGRINSNESILAYLCGLGLLDRRLRHDEYYEYRMR